MPNKVVIAKDKLEVKSLLGKLKLALNSGNIIVKTRDEEGKSYMEVTSILFPDKDPVDGIKEELRRLNLEDYIEVIEHNRDKNNELWVFGKKYSKGGVYIKFCVTLFKGGCNHETYVFSFHWAKWVLTDDMFPFIKTQKEG